MTSHSDELMALHLDALFTRDATGDLVRVREYDGAPAPRFFLGRTEHGLLRAYRHDVNNELRRKLEAASTQEGIFGALDLTANAATLAAGRVAVLARDEAVEVTEAGPVFCFPNWFEAAASTSRESIVVVGSGNTTLLDPLLAQWIPDVQHSQPLVALVLDGRAIAICGSVRRTGHAHEAGVEVAVDFRGHGYAGHVVAAWARAVRACGVEPLYSADWHNIASLAVARKLGLVIYGEELLIW